MMALFCDDREDVVGIVLPNVQRQSSQKEKSRCSGIMQTAWYKKSGQ